MKLLKIAPYALALATAGVLLLGRKKDNPILGPTGIQDDPNPGPRAKEALPGDFIKVSNPTHQIPGLEPPNKVLGDLFVSQDPDLLLASNPALASALATIRSWIANQKFATGVFDARVNRSPLSIVVATSTPVAAIQQYFPATLNGIPVVLTQVT